jgi:hypothetical protein
MEDFQTVAVFEPSARPKELRHRLVYDPRRAANYEYGTAEDSVDDASACPLNDRTRIEHCLFGGSDIMCADFALFRTQFQPKTEGKRMKKITLAVVTTAFAAATISAGAATTSTQPSYQDVQQSCPVAPAVANAYLRAQADRLKMPRGAVIAEITKDTGTDGEFAGLKPCDSGYPNAVRFFIDEVIKAGTNNSTP